MRTLRWLGVAAALMLSGPSVLAEDPIGRISLGGSGGFSTYALGDINGRIQNEGNHFLKDLHQPRLRGLEAIGLGWTFWGDLKLPVPFFESFFLTGGFGVSSGKTESPDMDNYIEVAVRQEAYHLRLLYTLPFRFHENVRLFVGGGPLIITNQEMTATQTNRSVADEEWTEKVVYGGSGMGWQVGIAAEYMLQDHMTLAVDFAYRMADIDHEGWTARENVTLSVSPSAEEEEYERLHLDDTYIGHTFLDWEETLARGADDPLVDVYGPHYEQMVPLTPQDLGIDLTGLQIHLGLRFYFL
ncbi:MAG: outer membrane beta-barrel protein [Candidatus Eisenbacteria sp.]|nr:outer membrane beta-barrel protein [Candidatus Eisenbacteria bacterium]